MLRRIWLFFVFFLLLVDSAALKAETPVEIKKNKLRKTETKTLERRPSNHALSTRKPSEESNPQKTQSRLKTFGVQIGLNMASASVSYKGISVPLDSKSGFLIGGNLTIQIADWFFLRPGLQYIQRGFSQTITSKSTVTTTSSTIQYVELPILGLGRIQIQKYPMKPYLFFGPNLGFKLSAGCSSSGTSSCTVDSSQIKAIHLGLDVGGGFEYQLPLSGTHLYVQICSSNGMTNVADTGDADLSFKNAGIEIIVGAQFRLGRES